MPLGILRMVLREVISEELRPQVGVLLKEKAIVGRSPQTPIDHSPPASGQGILAFSRNRVLRN